jgi:hypothetical protein
MTRNSRKKNNLSIKKFPSRKKQIGGMFPSHTPNMHSAYSTFSPHTTTAGHLGLQSMRNTQSLTDYITSDKNLQNMLIDSTGDGTFYGKFDSIRLELDKIRNDYISVLKENDSSITKVTKAAKKAEPLCNSYILKIDVLNKNVASTAGKIDQYNQGQQEHEFKLQKINQTVKLNKIRISILEELRSIITDEIRNLLSLKIN